MFRMNRWGLVAMAAAALWSSASGVAAQDLLPAGWVERLEAGALVMEGSSGEGDITIRRHDGTDLEAIALAVLAPDRPPLQIPRGDSDQREGESYGRGYMRTDTDPWMLFQVFVIPHATGGSVSMYSRFSATAAGAAQDHQDVFVTLGEMAAAGEPIPMAPTAATGPEAPTQTPSATTPNSTSADPTPASGRPAATATSSGPALAVAAVVFDLDYRYGLGGAVSAHYEPVFLLADGRACQCASFAPSDVTESVLAGVDAGHRGTWRRAGAGYVVTYDDDSDPEEVDGDLSAPTPLPRASALVGRYQAIGGGGNTSLGGSVMTAAVEDLTFFADGSFSQENFTMGSAPGATAWSKRGTAGTWALEGADLTLAYRDGQTRRTSVYYSEKAGRRDGSDPFGVLWIGGEDFKKR